MTNFFYKTNGQLTTDSLGNAILTGVYYGEFLYNGPIKTHAIQRNQIGRLDIISWLWFNDSSYARYIFDFNNIVDPIADIAPPVVLDIPIDLKKQLANYIANTYPGVLP